MHKLLAALIICMVLSAGCAPVAVTTPMPRPTPRPTPVFDLLADSTCEKPCVLGITPDDTTMSEALTILQRNPLPLGCKLQDASSLQEHSWDRGIECDSGYSNHMFVWSGVYSGVVTSITIDGTNLTLERVLARLGPPDEVNVMIYPDDRSIGGGGPDARARLLYRSLGALVEFSDNQKADYFQMRPELLVSVSFQPEYTLEQGDFGRIGQPQAWHGYGAYSP